MGALERGAYLIVSVALSGIRLVVMVRFGIALPSAAGIL